MTEQAVQSDAMADDRAAEAAGGIPSWLVWVLIVVGILVGWANSFVHTWNRWFPEWKRTNLSLYDRITGGQSYYTHGPLVPLVSLLIAALLIRHTRIRVNPSRKWGGLVIGMALLMHLAASLARVSFASMFALIVLIAGLVLFFWGREALNRLWFPIAFLCFMVPLPEVSITQMNFRLKMFAAEIGTDLVSVAGVPVLRDGNVVSLPGPTPESELKKLEVANVCNGLRTLISLTAFGALYAYVCKLRGPWRLLLFALSVPVALVANSLRITSLILVAHIWSVPTATGLYHDLSGLAIFVLAFMLMFGIENLILFLIGSFKKVEVRGLYEGVRRDENDPPQLGRMVRSVAGRAGLVVALVLIALSAYAVVLQRTIHNSVGQEQLRQSIPIELTVYPDKEPYFGEETELEPEVMAVLEHPIYVRRQYRHPKLPPVFMALIYSSDNRKGIHPPDQCLAGAGQGIVEKNDLEIEVPGVGTVPCRELVIQDEGARNTRTLVVYTYKCGGTYTTSFYRQQWEILLNGLLNRDASGALVQATTRVIPGREEHEEARQRALDLLKAVIPHVEKPAVRESTGAVAQN